MLSFFHFIHPNILYKKGQRDCMAMDSNKENYYLLLGTFSLCFHQQRQTQTFEKKTHNI